MDAWCEAICCRHIYFKTLFQSAPEHAIFVPLPDFTPIRRERPHPASTHPLSAYGASILAPSALNRWPLTKILNTPCTVVDEP